VVDSNRSAKPPIIAFDGDRNGDVDDDDDMVLVLPVATEETTTVAAVRLEVNCRNALCPAAAAGGGGGEYR